MVLGLDLVFEDVAHVKGLHFVMALLLCLGIERELVLVVSYPLRRTDRELIAEIDRIWLKWWNSSD